MTTSTPMLHAVDPEGHFQRRAATAWAGALYLLIIIAGVWSEAAVRAPLLLENDPAGTLDNLRASLPWVRASIAADCVMLLADAALALLLYRLLYAHGPLLALSAMILRLLQAAVLGANLLKLQSVALLASGTAASTMLGDGVAALATHQLQAHAQGYDLGLVFFGVNSVLTGWLLVRTTWAPSMMGPLLMAAGLVYLAGSSIRMLTPAFSEAFAPAYAVPLLAESLFCLWLLWTGLGRKKLTPQQTPS